MVRLDVSVRKHGQTVEEMNFLWLECIIATPSNPFLPTGTLGKWDERANDFSLLLQFSWILWFLLFLLRRQWYVEKCRWADFPLLSSYFFGLVVIHKPAVKI